VSEFRVWCGQPRGGFKSPFGATSPPLPRLSHRRLPGGQRERRCPFQKARASGQTSGPRGAHLRFVRCPFVPDHRPEPLPDLPRGAGRPRQNALGQISPSISPPSNSFIPGASRHSGRRNRRSRFAARDVSPDQEGRSGFAAKYGVEPRRDAFRSAASSATGRWRRNRPRGRSKASTFPPPAPRGAARPGVPFRHGTVPSGW